MTSEPIPEAYRFEAANAVVAYMRETPYGVDYGETTILETIEAAVALEHAAQVAVAASVLLARRRRKSWRSIGAALGVSAQAAQQRYGTNGR